MIAQCLTQQSLQFFSESTCNQKYIYIYPQSLNKLAVCKLVKSVWGKPTINDFLTFFKFTSVGFPGRKNPQVPRIRNTSPRVGWNAQTNKLTEVRLSINSWRWSRNKTPPQLLKMPVFLEGGMICLTKMHKKTHRFFLLLLFFGGKIVAII